MIASRFTKALAICIAALLLIVAFYPYSVGDVYQQTYVACGMAILIEMVLLSFYVIKKGFDIFESLYFISVLYGFLYFITPMYDICVGETLWFGYDLFESGVKATGIAAIGYIAFFAFYAFKFVYKPKQEVQKKEEKAPILISESKRKLIVAVVIAIYALSFAANVFYLVRSGGVSFLYIITLGLLGDGYLNASSAPLGFVSMFSYCLPAATLLYWEYGKSKTFKWVLFVPVVILQVARGFRFFVIQIAITFFAYVFIRKNQRPKLRHIVVAALAVSVPVLVMTLFRDTMRSGEGMAFNTINFESIRQGFEEAFWDNLRIYKNFYGLVAAVPEKYGFVYGRQMIIGTLVMVIPRIIWPGKISTEAGEELDVLIGGNLKDVGQALPNIGEYYYAIGIFGVILFMAIYGWWMKKIREKLEKTQNDCIQIIMYSILLGINLQLLIRGYTPSNFWYIVFSILPILIVKILLWEKNEDING